MLNAVRAAAVAVAVLAASADRAPTAPGRLEPLRFLTGCWRGPSGNDQVVEEHYTSPSANLMLGMARYTRAGVATSYEFYTITAKDSGLVFTPRLEGQAPVAFPLARLGKESVTWENPTHDFPTRIAYRRVPGDSLVARIEGPGPDGRTASEEWRMARARCED